MLGGLAGPSREAKSTISAPAGVLWQIMMEVEKYPQGYSVMLEASGTPRLGAKLKFRVKASDGSPRQLSFTGTIVEFVPERRLVWTGGIFPILMGRLFLNLCPWEMTRRTLFRVKNSVGSIH